MFSFSKFENVAGYKEFNPKGIISPHYKVWVNGQEVPVYTCRISRYPFNRGWNGVQRNSNQSEVASYINLISDEELKIEVETTLEHSRVMLKPYSKGVKTVKENGKIAFTLTENGYFVLELDSYHHCLYIFNKKQVLCEKPEEVKYYFGAGVHFPGIINLQTGDKVYVDKDALVYGSIFAKDAENIEIFGNGIFNGGLQERITGITLFSEYCPGNMKFIDCKNVKVRGVGMQDSSFWCISMFRCFNMEIDGVQVFGEWKYNTDGIDICNSQNVSIKNSLIHAFDDGIVIKGIDEFAFTDNANILVENCAVWCDWGKTLEIGIESTCRENRDITFRNIDILRAGNTACDIQNGDIAEDHHILFENINIEYNDFDTPEVFQIDDDDVYSVEGRIRKDVMECGVGNIAVPRVLNLVNHGFHENVNAPFRGEAVELLKQDLPNRRVNHHITLKNIHVYYDEDIPMVEGKYNVPILVKETYQGAHYHDILIDGLYVNGEKITKETAYLMFDATEGCLEIK